MVTVTVAQRTDHVESALRPSTVNIHATEVEVVLSTDRRTLGLGLTATHIEGCTEAILTAQEVTDFDISTNTDYMLVERLVAGSAEGNKVIAGYKNGVSA